MVLRSALLDAWRGHSCPRAFSTFAKVTERPW